MLWCNPAMSGAAVIGIQINVSTSASFPGDGRSMTLTAQGANLVLAPRHLLLATWKLECTKAPSWALVATSTAFASSLQLHVLMKEACKKEVLVAGSSMACALAADGEADRGDSFKLVSVRGSWGVIHTTALPP